MVVGRSAAFAKRRQSIAAAAQRKFTFQILLFHVCIVTSNVFFVKNGMKSHFVILHVFKIYRKNGNYLFFGKLSSKIVAQIFKMMIIRTGAINRSRSCLVKNNERKKSNAHRRLVQKASSSTDPGLYEG